MDSAFVAQWFDDRDRPLVGEIDRILYSHGVRAVTGHVLGGDALDDAIKRRLDDSDCLVALATRRDEIVRGGWTTHPWVINEFAYAKAKQKEAIALVEGGVSWQGPYQAHEYIKLDRGIPSVGLLELSNTIGYWKENAGNTLKLQILPDQLAERLELEGDNCECTYRTVEQGKHGEWRQVMPVPEPGGVYLYVKGIQNKQLIEVRVSSNRWTWKSPATPQSMPVILRELR
jgi:hypothetical protein